MAQVSFQDAGGRLYGEMQKCIIYIQNHPDQDITMEDLAGRMAYAPIQLSYLFDLFFEKSLEEWDIEKIRAYQGKGKIPYERVIDKENTEICFVRRREQKIVAESILFETEKSPKGSFLEAAMEKVEEHAKDNWRKRTSTEERMLFWWHDSEYRFHFLSGREQSKNEGKERGERETFEVVLEASDYVVFTWKENFTGRAAESMLKMVLKYALCDWETENQIWYDQNKIYFISYENGKYYVYMPLQKKIQENYKIKSTKQERKIYGLNEWIDYIDEHIKEELTAKNLATVFGYSERHFRNVFQIYYDIKLNDYIRRRKLYFAAQELKKGKKPETVARQYAFKSSSRFSRAFHEEYGMTPEKYYKEEFRNEEWIRYIDEHMKEELTAEQLAKEFHYSKDHFRKEFQNVFGMGPYENGKYYVYMPLQKKIQENYKIKSTKQERKIYGLNEWIDYIDEHIKEELTAKNLATVFGYSERHFRNVFQIYYDIKLNDYIRRRKLYFAAQELKKGKKPETVARQYAFKSSSRFSRAFHEEYGMTPEKYYKEEFRNEEWIRYIDEHMKEELTAEQLAKEFHYSKDHFRKEFQNVFGMGPITYITQRKVQFAAKALREGKLPAEVGKEYGFCSRNGFDKAFRRVFYTSPAKYARAGAKVVNLDRYYSEYKDKIKISYIDMDEIKMAGWTIIANRREADIPAQLAFWLDEHSPQYRKLNALTGEEKGRDKIALWYQEKENIEYILGPIVESFDNLPEDAFQVRIAAGRYAVFESDQENDMENLPETVRMFARCVLYGWIREHRDELSLQRLTFERYTSQKMYLYVPVSEKGTGGNERKDEKNFEKQSEK